MLWTRIRSEETKKKSGYRGLAFSMFFTSIRIGDLGGTEQLTQGLRVRWSGQVSEVGVRGGDRSLRGLSALKNDILQSCTDLLRTSARLEAREKTKRQDSFAHQEAKGPEFNNASITGQPTCSYDTYGENDLALQLLFFPPSPSRQLLRFDFNAFLCSFVFSCKNLTVLECLYFIKCV